MATVHVPPQLRSLTGGSATVDVSGHTLKRVVEELEVSYPGFAARVTLDGQISPGLAFSIDNVVASLGLLSRVETQSVIHIVPGIAGG
jgi:molybdopterin converting factor small subunit